MLLDGETTVPLFIMYCKTRVTCPIVIKSIHVVMFQCVMTSVMSVSVTPAPAVM